MALTGEEVVKERGNHYGDFHKNFQCIADFWTVYLKGKYGAAFEIQPIDVAFLMGLLKTGRHATGNSALIDNAVDVQGYGYIAEQILKGVKS